MQFPKRQARVGWRTFRYPLWSDSYWGRSRSARGLLRASVQQGLLQASYQSSARGACC